MPKKPTKWGFRVIARAGTDEFIYDFALSTGKTTTEEANKAKNAGLSIPS